MSTIRLCTVPYDRPLPRPLVTAHGVYERRRGILCHLEDDSGHCGLGDASPLPGFSRETIEKVSQALGALQQRLDRETCKPLVTPNSFADLASMSHTVRNWSEGLPSLRFALESALADLAARKAGQPLARWFTPDAFESAEINALLDGSTTMGIAELARARAAAGFAAFKIKVGTGSVADDVGRVAAVRAAVPDAQIRVDANGGWSEAEARDAFTGMSALDLEFIEQPLPVGHVAASRSLSREFGIPLAFDEEIGTVSNALALIEGNLCEALVLKPMVLGGITDCWTVIDAARPRGVKVVLTSSWESDVGLAATLHLALAAGEICAASGLSTAGMIAGDLIEPTLAIQSGCLQITGAHGLGLDCTTTVAGFTTL